MLIIVLGIMGAGKTLFATNYALRYSKGFRNNKIYANYRLKLNNAVYSPFMYLPFSQLMDCLIICDDFYALDNLKTFTQIICNISRKRNLTIILTAQDYTMIPARIRRVSNYIVETNLLKNRDYMKLRFIFPNGKIKKKVLRNPIANVKNLYDTNEVVVFPLEREIKEEIINVSKNLKDVEFNLQMYSGNIKTRERLLKEIKREIDFN